MRFANNRGRPMTASLNAYLSTTSNTNITSTGNTYLRIRGGAPIGTAT